MPMTGAGRHGLARTRLERPAQAKFDVPPESPVLAELRQSVDRVKSDPNRTREPPLTTLHPAHHNLSAELGRITANLGASTCPTCWFNPLKASTYGASAKVATS